jgi:hypothetical protein
MRNFLLAACVLLVGAALTQAGPLGLFGNGNRARVSVNAGACSNGSCAVGVSYVPVQAQVAYKAMPAYAVQVQKAPESLPAPQQKAVEVQVEAAPATMTYTEETSVRVKVGGFFRNLFQKVFHRNGRRGGGC